MSSPAKKRRRVDISASQKRDVCLYKEQHPKATQAQILVHFSNEWGVSVGRSTISDILRDKVKWLSVRNVVRESDTPENPDSDSNDDESPPPRVVTGLMAKNGLADVLTYTENQPSCAHRLSELLSIIKDL